MPSGTSIKGYQTLITGVSNTNNFVYLVIPQDTPERPQRLGFLYILTGVIGFPEFTVVTETRLVYGPGISFVFTPVGSPTTDAQAIVVNWNFPGLDWELFLGA